ncbi:Alcohol dehydrogenase [Actinomadura rubteroloni]|uniref:Alcohol dehydrogenase n=1 Tax=Actinomadura rubteroloni TaxID=1926885 RepID=A0A2P4URJ2_9ACTN|nr:glucose 1-dehydrogenase [Actinomadura rubteroloni]POM27672.1 Alcohol dehydrogenase [Actinomadura rubteroloni]
MKALTVVPGRPDQVRVEELPDPVPGPGDLLVEGRLLGICGTDNDIVESDGYGWTPPGRDRLIIGHESLGTVVAADPTSGFAEGDLVVGVVRRPDPVPCVPCAHDEADFCRNGRYTERGIKELDGFGAQLWLTEDRYAVKLDPALGDNGVLLEPATVIAKAWEQTDRFLTRTSWRPEVVLVTGAGTIGLFAALMAVQRGLEVHVVDNKESAAKRALVQDLGGTFHTADVRDIGVRPDVVIECTGHGPLLFQLTEIVAPDAVICLTGISSGQRKVPVPADAINKGLVLDNTVIFGSVNAARRNFQQAADALAKADAGWLDRLITRRVPMEAFSDGLRREPDDIKVVVDLRS